MSRRNPTARNVIYANPFLFWPFTLYRGRLFRVYRIFVLPVLGALPAFLAYGVGLFVADVQMRLSPAQRRTVSQNMGNVFGSTLATKARSRYTRDLYRVQSCTMVDEARATWKDDPLFGLIEVRGEDRVRKSLARGKGVLLLGAHYGSYRVLSSLLGGRGVSVSQLSRAPSELNPKARPRVKFIHRMLVTPITRNIGKPFIRVQMDNVSEGEFGGGVKAVMALRSNEVVLSQLDAVPSERDLPRAVSVDFLGRRIRVLAGAVTLARAAGSEIFVLLIQRRENWRQQTVSISGPIDLDGSDKEVYQRCLSILDRAVREKPGHWQFWADDRPARLGLMSGSPNMVLSQADEEG